HLMSVRMTIINDASSNNLYIFIKVMRRSPRHTLFPYTTLFRSAHREHARPIFVGAVLADDRIVERDLAEHGEHHGDRRSEHCPADRKSTRLNSSHLVISYAVFCLKKKRKTSTPLLAQYQHISIQ